MTGTVLSYFIFGILCCIGGLLVGALGSSDGN